MKTVEDYLNDPRLVNDPDMADALEPVRRIHAIRLKIQDERAEMIAAGMTTAEINALYKKQIAESFARQGLPPPQYVSRAGMGKIKPKKVVGE